MMLNNPAIRTGIGLFALIGAALLFTFTRLPIEGVQHGYRGTGEDQIFNPRTIEAQGPLNVIPATLPPVQSGPPAATVYKNVQVLGGLSVGAFTRLMASITTWVAPVQGCAYCHALNNMADDSLYTKVVARKMIQMTQHINGDWKTHVVGTGVTCYTCHRGNPVPGAQANSGEEATRANLAVWYRNAGPSRFNGMAETQTGKNLATPAIGDTSLPYDPFTPFLEDSKNIRVQATEPLPDTDMSTIKQTDWTYALMIHFSQSLGVNCSYCHNTRAFSDWSQSAPQRTTAWYGIRMVRDINLNYLDALQNVFPAYRLGEQGDSPKVNCTTCHQGVYKPLFGKSPLTGFPELSALGAALPK
jgi:photosynthetic reaction center cytochrome c subunit